MSDEKTWQVPDGYAPIRKRETIKRDVVSAAEYGSPPPGRSMLTVRAMTLDEIKALGYGDHPSFLANDGTVRRVKINGAVKRWKREPDRVRVSVKYGLYETAQFETAEALTRFVVVVDKVTT